MSFYFKPRYLRVDQNATTRISWIERLVGSASGYRLGIDTAVGGSAWMELERLASQGKKKGFFSGNLRVTNVGKE